MTICRQPSAAIVNDQLSGVQQGNRRVHDACYHDIAEGLQPEETLSLDLGEKPSSSSSSADNNGFKQYSVEKWSTRDLDEAVTMRDNTSEAQINDGQQQANLDNNVYS